MERKDTLTLGCELRDVGYSRIVASGFVGGTWLAVGDITTADGDPLSASVSGLKRSYEPEAQDREDELSDIEAEIAELLEILEDNGDLW